MFIVANWKGILTGIAACTVLSGILLVYTYHKAYQNAYTRLYGEINTQTLKEIKESQVNNENVKIEVIGLNNAELDKRLSRWMRD